MSEDQSSADLAPIMWKWLVRLIWFGSIGFFQFAEIERCLSSNTYRPFFGLYAGLVFALVIWFIACAIRNIAQRAEAWQGPSG
ncbi:MULTISPECIES: hypothetical protein [Bradyrhizobium]|uniref:hypothetical protein n=1 Tax=Bradyrhizobium TaxID=374 RepID=UPI00067F2A1E|nr:MULTISPECIES: hypothetical protein [Bradyrhizobium]PAY06539.1 hypothetical protein CK489_27030 [Bradyrhizobium sp. UFLA03-84]